MFYTITSVLSLVTSKVLKAEFIIIKIIFLVPFSHVNLTEMVQASEGGARRKLTIERFKPFWIDMLYVTVRHGLDVFGSQSSEVEKVG